MPCVALYGGHICDEPDQDHDTPHLCECGATWTREESDT